MTFGFPQSVTSLQKRGCGQRVLPRARWMIILLWEGALVLRMAEVQNDFG